MKTLHQGRTWSVDLEKRVLFEQRLKYEAGRPVGRIETQADATEISQTPQYLQSKLQCAEMSVLCVLCEQWSVASGRRCRCR